MRSFDTIVAFGDRPAIERIRSQADPECRFVAHGPPHQFRVRHARVARPQRRSSEIAFWCGARRVAVLATPGGLSVAAHVVRRVRGVVSPVEADALLSRHLTRARSSAPASSFPPGSDSIHIEPPTLRRRTASHDVATFRSANGSGGSVASDASHEAYCSHVGDGTRSSAGVFAAHDRRARRRRPAPRCDGIRVAGILLTLEEVGRCQFGARRRDRGGHRGRRGSDRARLANVAASAIIVAARRPSAHRRIRPMGKR